jgi:hypothetical protein
MDPRPVYPSSDGMISCLYIQWRPSWRRQTRPKTSRPVMDRRGKTTVQMCQVSRHVAGGLASRDLSLFLAAIMSGTFREPSDRVEMSAGRLDNQVRTGNYNDQPSALTCQCNERLPLSLIGAARVKSGTGRLASGCASTCQGNPPLAISHSAGRIPRVPAFEPSGRKEEHLFRP